MERVNVSAAFGVQTNGVYDRRCLMYMLGFGRTLSDVEQIIDSNTLCGYELHGSVWKAIAKDLMEHSYDFSRDEIDLKCLAAHLCRANYTATDYDLYITDEYLRTIPLTHETISFNLQTMYIYCQVPNLYHSYF